MQETYFVVDALKQVSGFKWDEENGADINSNTLPVWNAYIEVCALSILHYSLTIDLPRGTQRLRASKQRAGHTISACK
jgi:hypothetical protein